MTKPRFVNVYVFLGREGGKPETWCSRDWGSRLDADSAAIGFGKATALEPHLGRHLRAAGVAFRVKVTMKEAR